MSTASSMGAALVLLTAISGSAGAETPPKAPEAKPAPDIKVITTEPIHALVLPMKGSYMQHPAAFERLGAALASRGVAPLGAAFGRYFSDPSVGEENLVWEVGLPIPAGVTAEAPFEIKDIPGSLAAVHVHRGPMGELGTAWTELVQWTISNGYQPQVPAVQIFLGDPSALQVEMRLPVHKIK
jgi:effector-binding domain-containing protein